ncbi:hypothetical protein IEQ34_000923 [Dendrobium chrysotoxum]|uniref:Cysteine-rich receptor-like protein kinase n=1 Tax=Dendrobium chrysotoxum TaxID=161865 RepID=A0AAV7H5D1_DENCH|nr:hypothetical protein IEQ34_000923 [Dendrobium chrysotoxum]
MLLLPSPSFFLIIFIPFVAIQSFAEDIPYFSYCSGDNFTSPSFYERRLRLLLQTINEWGSSLALYNTGVFGNSPSFRIFALVQCRPNISITICNECLNYSASVVISNSSGGCGSSRSAVVRFDLCVFRYSDHRFFGIPEQKPFRFIPTISLNVTDGINANARDRLRDVLPRAAMNDSRFAEQITKDSGGLLIVAVAWCTMDLSTGDCLQCLRRAEESFPDGKYFGIVTSISCEVRLLTDPTSLDNRWSPSPLSPLLDSNSAVPVAQPRPSREGKMTKTAKMILLAGAFGVVISSLLFITFFLQQKRRNKKLTPLSTGKKMEEEILDAMKSTVFDLGAIRAATNNFTEENVLGHCGFAVIYKGVLQHGQEIAVKRLSRTSEQGLLEMENEVNLVTKLQHKNLVRLLGYFLEEEEKLLVYEYLPNASLAKFLYDPVKRRLLDWGTRFKIIVGISRGLLYLHEDSLHRIVHCNLNASNILLDSSMDPKISEFGFAKLFSVDETERYISQIVGTFEYLAPESAHHGIFSTKSDVFSFGVLVLEIITGQRIGNINNADLLRNVWKHWRQGMAWKVIDKSMGAEYSSKEAFKCIEIGLLCLQENHRDRPDMASLVAMLGTL